jgi:large subunit ribosomal protein L6
MSRVGRQPVAILAGVNVEVTAKAISVKGPKGTLSEKTLALVSVEVHDGQVVVGRTSDSKQGRANHGLMRALIQNMVTGVTKGFDKDLEIIGVGYRAEVKGKNLVMQLGYSHPIEHAIPEGIAVSVDRNTKIKVSGASKQQVGQQAAEIRAYRKPDHYKGKGVRYVNEYVLIKAGKSA